MGTRNWHKSSFSSGGDNCVDVRVTEETVQVRNSKRIHLDPQVFTHDEWDAFIKGVKAGEFD